MGLQAGRAFGGMIGLAIFTVMYSWKLAGNVPDTVAPVALQDGVPAYSLPALFSAISPGNPQLLAAVSGMTGRAAQLIGAAYQEASSMSFRYVWFALMSFAAAVMIAALFVQEIPDKMTNFVECDLEDNEVRKNQSL